MSPDQRLQSLKAQHAAEPGDVPTEVQLLRARVRAEERSGLWCDNKSWHDPRCSDPNPCPTCNGTGRRLLKDALPLAAYVGHEASRALVPDLECGPCSRAYGEDARIEWDACVDRNLIEFWLKGLSPWGEQVMVTAAVASGRVVLHEWEAKRMCFCHPDSPAQFLHEDEQGILDSLEAWEARPVQETGDDWVERGENEHCPDCNDTQTTDLGPRRALDAAQRWLDDPSEANRETWDRAVVSRGMPHWVAGPFSEYVAVILAAAREAGEGPVRAAIKAALVPWALSGPA